MPAQDNLFIEQRSSEGLARTRRYPFSAGIELDWGSSVLRGKIRDIGPDDMFIEIDQAPWVSVCFSARVELEKPLPLECSIQWIVPPQGVGVSIAVPDTEAMRRFNALLATLRDQHALAAKGLPDPGIATAPATRSLFPFEKDSILLHAPRLSGVYAIRNAQQWIYVGEANDMQSRLLGHLCGDHPTITRHRPVAFRYELVPPNQRWMRQVDMILELKPLCNRRLGSRLRTPFR